MTNYRPILFQLARRSVPASLLMAAGWSLIGGASGGWAATPRLLLAMALIVLAAVIVAEPLAALVAEPLVEFLRLDRPLDRPMPAYGIPESLRKRGKPKESFEGLRAIALKHPQELRAYVEMIDVALLDLHDRDLARTVLQQGCAALTRVEDREALERLYLAIGTRLDVPPKPPQPRLKK